MVRSSNVYRDDSILPEMVIPSEFEAARRAEQAVLQELDRFGYDDDAIFAIKLALEESLQNAIKHGNRRDPSKKVTLNYDVTEQKVTISITDEGPGFDPQDVPDPTADENLEKPSGRGIMLMRAYMDEVCYKNNGTQIYMVKHKN